MKKHAIAVSAAMMIGAATGAFAQVGQKMAPPNAAGSGPSMDGSARSAPAAETPSIKQAPSMKEAPATRGGEGASSGNPEAQGAEGPAGDGPAKADKSEKTKSPKKAEKKDNTPSKKSAEDMKTSPAGKNGERAEKTSPGRDAKDGAPARDKAANAPDAGEKKSNSQADAVQKGDTKSGDKQAAGDRKAADTVRSVDVSGERRNRVQSALRQRGDVKHRTRVDIDISIGRRLPRDWDYAPVPVAVIEVVPEYRGYVYTYVDDDYVIADPDTYEVVAVLPASGGGASYAGREGSGACSTSLSLSDGERADLVKSIQIVDEQDVSGVSIGWQVPGSIELRTFPEPVVTRTEKLSACRYFVAEGQIAIVDPSEDKVVLLIEPAN
jgi:hypothetical protein